MHDVKLVISSILPASDRDAEREKERDSERACARERERETERARARERDRESERRDSCMCELVYLHLRVTTNNEYLSLVI